MFYVIQNEPTGSLGIVLLLQDTAEHVSKTEDRVTEIVENEGKITKKVGNIENQMAQMKTEMAQMEKKVDNVDNDVHISWFNWKFIGHGYYRSVSHCVEKFHTTLQECIEFCTKKRLDSGAAWNGLSWDLNNGRCVCNENDVGHTESASYLHFKIQQLQTNV